MIRTSGHPQWRSQSAKPKENLKEFVVAIPLPARPYVVRLDKRPDVVCHDRAEALPIAVGLLRDHHAQRIAMLHA